MRSSELTHVITLATVRLVADSPKGAWYELTLTKAGEGGYVVTKTSGCRSGTLDTRSWPFQELAAAERRYGAILRRKTNPDRQGRRYQPAG